MIGLLCRKPQGIGVGTENLKKRHCHEIPPQISLLFWKTYSCIIYIHDVVYLPVCVVFDLVEM